MKKMKNKHKSSKTQKTILITGASTGIGRDIAETLAARGEQVFAGARKQTDITALNEIANITALSLDVTKEEEIRAAVDLITEKVGHLDVLINNAGISQGGPLVDMPEALLRSMFEVNVFGPYKVTKACFPLLHTAKGHIINVSSVSGLVATPFLGVYCMSKHALEAYSDSLRHEVRPLGIKVSIIEPGAIKTPIWDKASELSNGSEQWISPLFLERSKKLADLVIPEGKENSLPVAKVSKTLCKAIYSKHPKTRYLVVDHRFLLKLFMLFPDSLVDKLIANTA